MFVTYSFFVPSIRCVNCFEPIKEALMQCRPLGLIQIEIDDKEVSIQIPQHLNETFVQSKINEALRPLGHTLVFTEKFFHEQTKTQMRSHRWRGLLGTLTGFALLILTMIWPVPMMVMIPITLGSGLLTLMLGAPSYQRAWIELKQLWQGRVHLSMDSLFALSSLVVIAVSIAAFFVPGLPMMMETGLLVFGFRHLGLVIEGSMTRSMRLRGGFMDGLPSKVRVQTPTGMIEKPLAAITMGEVIEIQPDNMIPLDGESLTAGQYLYDTIVTGAYLPRALKQNEALLSGMRLGRGGAPLLLKVTEPLASSHLKRRDQYLSATKLANQAELQVFAKKLLNYFIPAILLLSITSTAILALFFSWTIAISCGIAVLVSACPCTLGLVVPLAVKIGMRKAGSVGVQFRSKEQLQRAGEVDCVVLDLNGTLTHGRPTVIGTPVFDSSVMTEDAFYQAIATLEKDATHPHGRVLHHYARAKIVAVADASVCRQHFGMSGNIVGHTYHIGSEQMMRLHEMDIQAYRDAQRIGLNPGETVVYLARDQRVIGHMILSDPLRAEARHIVDSLKELGKKIYICTGADLQTAQQFAQLLDIPARHVRAAQRSFLGCGLLRTSEVPVLERLRLLDTSHYVLTEAEFYYYNKTTDVMTRVSRTPAILAELHRYFGTLHIEKLSYQQLNKIDTLTQHTCPLEDDKSSFIKQLKAQGYRVAMVGDAGNDALAIAASHFGLAVRSVGGDAVSQAEAGAVIYSTSLLPVVSAFAVAKQTVNHIKQNLFFSLGYNLLTEVVAGGCLASFGVLLNPGIGVALMIVQMCLILGNAYRFKHQPLVHLSPLEGTLRSSPAAAAAAASESNRQSFQPQSNSRPLPNRVVVHATATNARQALVSPDLWAPAANVSVVPSPPHSLHF
jgi:Cu2+-exporting ATPase